MIIDKSPLAAVSVRRWRISDTISPETSTTACHAGAVVEDRCQLLAGNLHWRPPRCAQWRIADKAEGLEAVAQTQTELEGEVHVGDVAPLGPQRHGGGHVRAHVDRGRSRQAPPHQVHGGDGAQPEDTRSRHAAAGHGAGAEDTRGRSSTRLLLSCLSLRAKLATSKSTSRPPPTAGTPAGPRVPPPAGAAAPAAPDRPSTGRTGAPPGC
jgi:hypothetical protein